MRAGECEDVLGVWYERRVCVDVGVERMEEWVCDTVRGDMEILRLRDHISRWQVQLFRLQFQHQQKPEWGAHINAKYATYRLLHILHGIQGIFLHIFCILD